MLKERGLLIADEAEATDYLKVISYFRLANYLRPMEQDKEKHLYKPNSYFETLSPSIISTKNSEASFLQQYNPLK